MIAQLAARIRAAISGQPDEFAKLCTLYRTRLRNFPPPPAADASAKHAGVLVTQWQGTGVSHFALECAQMLARRGVRVTLIHDETDVVGNAPNTQHTRAIEELLEQMKGTFPVVDVETLPAESESQKAEGGRPNSDFGLRPSDFLPAAIALLRENAIWRMRGETKAEEFIAARPEAVPLLAEHLGRIARMLREQAFDWILIPGGIFGLSGLYVSAARAVGLDFSTFDSGVGLLRLAQRGVAAHLADLPETFAEVRKRWQGAEREHVLRWVKTEMADRAAARDARQYQVAAATEQSGVGGDILVPLNIRWDSAALGRQRVFETVEEWLSTLLEWVAGQPGVTVTIREHPRERLSFAKSSDDFQPLLDRFAQLGDRLRFVKSADPVSTYDLLRSCKVVLPHTSTIGIEATILGKPAVLGTHCYYEDFGFVWPASTREEYFARIRDALDGLLTLSEEQRELAHLAYYLTQRCALMRSEFNPHAENMRKWCALAPEEVGAWPEVVDFCEAMVSRRPLPVLRYERLVREG